MQTHMRKTPNEHDQTIQEMGNTVKKMTIRTHEVGEGLRCKSFCNLLIETWSRITNTLRKNRHPNARAI